MPEPCIRRVWFGRWPHHVEVWVVPSEADKAEMRDAGLRAMTDREYEEWKIKTTMVARTFEGAEVEGFQGC